MSGTNKVHQDKFGIDFVNLFDNISFADVISFHKFINSVLGDKAIRDIVFCTEMDRFDYTRGAKIEKLISPHLSPTAVYLGGLPLKFPFSSINGGSFDSQHEAISEAMTRITKANMKTAKVDLSKYAEFGVSIPLQEGDVYQPHVPSVLRKYDFTGPSAKAIMYALIRYPGSEKFLSSSKKWGPTESQEQFAHMVVTKILDVMEKTDPIMRSQIRPNLQGQGNLYTRLVKEMQLMGNEFNSPEKAAKHLLSRASTRLQNIKKTSQDHRFIDKEITNPRQTTQYFIRSSIHDTDQRTIKTIKKLIAVCETIEQEYSKSLLWHESRAKLLLFQLRNVEKAFIANKSFTHNQPSLQSIDVLRQQLFARYRLEFDDILEMKDEDIRNTILSRDDELVLETPITSDDRVSISDTVKSAPNSNIVINVKNDNKKLDELLKTLDASFELNSSEDIKSLAEKIQKSILDKYSSILQTNIKHELSDDLESKAAILQNKINELDVLTANLKQIASSPTIKNTAYVPTTSSYASYNDGDELEYLISQYQVMSH
jgi:flavin-binding protein dodecin